MTMEEFGTELATLEAIAKDSHQAAPPTIEAACKWAHEEIITLRAALLRITREGDEISATIAQAALNKERED